MAYFQWLGGRKNSNKTKKKKRESEWGNPEIERGNVCLKSNPDKEKKEEEFVW